jgi:hypothetical protein
MPPTEKPSSRPFNATESEPNFLGPITPAVSGPLSFPSFDQILRHQAGVAPHPLLQLSDIPPPRTPTLFEGLLGGKLEVLTQDAVDHPDRYDEPTRTLLAELGASVKRLEGLTPADRAALDRATLDFAAYRPPRRAQEPVRARPRPARRPALLTQEAPSDGRAPQVETPGGVMTPYWWLT